MPSYDKPPNENAGISLIRNAQNLSLAPQSPISDPLDVPINGDANRKSCKSFSSNLSDTDDMMASMDEDEKIAELLSVFEPNDREAIMKVPASFEDLNLMVRLWQSGYFKGEHHLEEIMFYENLRRSQLLQLLDKFRDVLILYETEEEWLYFFNKTNF